MSYDWVTFDCYGTLIDWEAGMRAAFGEIMRRRGIPGAPDALTGRYIQYELLVERREYRPYRVVLAEACTLLFNQELNVALTAEEAGSLAASLPSWRPFDDARPALERLKKRYKLAVLSNVDDDLLAPSLRALGVPFDELVTAEQVRSYKPILSHWREALRRFGVTEDRVFHVGASYVHDMLPARQLGIACAWINRHDEKAAGSVVPDHSLRSLSGLPELLAA